jgi:DNA-binding transcriptional regulator LsrR (DeoR family)
MKNTPGDGLRAVPDRDPSAAELAEGWAHQLASEAAGMNAPVMLAAAQVHATLAISARLAEQTRAIDELTAAVESIGVTGAALTGVPA